MMPTAPRLNNDQAARKLISHVDSAVLRQVSQELRNGGTVGEWLEAGLRQKRHGNLSTGEVFLVDAVAAVYNGNRNAPLAGLLDIDKGKRASVFQILMDVWSER